MTVNGKTCRQTSSLMTITLDGHIADSRPVLGIDIVGESISIDVDDQPSSIVPRIHLEVPLPVRDWRLLDGLMLDSSFPETACLAWCIHPQMADLQSFRCHLKARQCRSFTIEFIADLVCYDFSDTGVAVSMTAVNQFTLDSITVGIPISSSSPIEDATTLLSDCLNLDSVLPPTLHCHRDHDQEEILAYEICFPTATSPSPAP